MRKVIPNLITIARIVGAIILLRADATTQVLAPFWGLYTFCGLTDIFDGVVARWLKVETKTGTLLDSVADIIFVVCAGYKLCPILMFTSWMWIWTAIIICVKVFNQISALVVYGKPVFPHTLANKITGLILFLSLPLYICFGWDFPLIMVSAIATFAAVQEGHYIRTKNIFKKVYYNL